MAFAEFITFWFVSYLTGHCSVVQVVVSWVVMPGSYMVSYHNTTMSQPRRPLLNPYNHENLKSCMAML